jgi:hypothetical protein
MIIKSNLAAIQVSLKLPITVFNVQLQTSSIQSITDADHAQLITYTMLVQNNATAESHVNFQDNLMLITSVIAQPIKREIEEYGTNQTKLATVLLIFHSGTVNIVLSVQLELNTIQKSINAIIAQKDLSEITAVTLVFHHFDLQIYRFIVSFYIFLFYLKKNFIVVGAKISFKIKVLLQIIVKKTKNKITKE